MNDLLLEYQNEDLREMTAVAAETHRRLAGDFALLTGNNRGILENHVGVFTQQEMEDFDNIHFLWLGLYALVAKLYAI